MIQHVNERSGEVTEVPMSIVPLNLGLMSEEELAQLIPTPGQALAALQEARKVNSRLPGALAERREELLKAERELSRVLGRTIKRLRTDNLRATLTELRDLAYSDEAVRIAQDERDTEWLLFEYAKDWARAIEKDNELLRSINANFRHEHRA